MAGAQADAKRGRRVTRLDWRKAGIVGKRTLSTRDEVEFRDRDAASRWLARNEKPKAKKRRRPAPAEGAAA